MNPHVLTAATLALGLFCPQLAAAPPQAARYAVTGSVIDQTQAFVPKAQVILTEISRDKKHKTRSDRDGRFRFDGLPRGDYVLHVALPGFVSVKSDVAISSQDVTLDVRLELGEMAEAVVVTRGQIVTPPSENRTFPRRKPPVCEGATEPRIGGNVRPPMKLRDVRPLYPRALKAAGIRGRVVVQAQVGADGLVSRPMVVVPARQEFADAAKEAVAQWLFDPVYLNCRPMAMRLTVDVEFTDEW